MSGVYYLAYIFSIIVPNFNNITLFLLFITKIILAVITMYMLLHEDYIVIL